MAFENPIVTIYRRSLPLVAIMQRLRIGWCFCDVRAQPIYRDGEIRKWLGLKWVRSCLDQIRPFVWKVSGNDERANSRLADEHLTCRVENTNLRQPVQTAQVQRNRQR